jgi:2-keto-4-pentenoate hydratase/2-oxohepta-3-ene-1,7-dioic acid hydratase in catechol pathway
MRIVRFAYRGKTSYGCVENDSVYMLSGSPFEGLRRGDEVARLDEVRLMAPCEPSKIVAVGLNYRRHAEETGHELPAEPVLFLKPPTAVVGPLADVVYPAMSQRVDYEAELAVVIGRRAKALTREEVPSHILGYTCGNDVTARDLQRKDGQWTRSKGFDTFCPLGPWIVTDLAHPGQVDLSCRVNGVTKQASNTNDLVFDIPTLVSYISQVMTLEPGDVVMTGTPSGIAPVQRGDVMEIDIEGIGALKNTVV